MASRIDSRVFSRADTSGKTGGADVQVTRDISRDHADTRNPVIARLMDQILRLNRLYEAGVQTWLVAVPSRG